MDLNFSAMFQGLAEGTGQFAKMKGERESEERKEAAQSARDAANQAFQENLTRFQLKEHKDLALSLDEKASERQSAHDLLEKERYDKDREEKAEARKGDVAHQKFLEGQSSAQTKLAQTAAEERAAEHKASAAKAEAQATKAEADVKAGEAKTIKEQALAGTSALDSQEKRYEESVRSARLTYENLSQNSSDKVAIAAAAKDLQDTNAKLKAVQAKNEKLREHYQTQLAPDYKEEKDTTLEDTAKEWGGKIGSAVSGMFVPKGGDKAATGADAAATTPPAAAVPAPAAAAPDTSKPMPGIGAPFVQGQTATTGAGGDPFAGLTDEQKAAAQGLVAKGRTPAFAAKWAADPNTKPEALKMAVNPTPPAGVPAAPPTTPVATPTPAPAAAAPPPAGATPPPTPAPAAPTGGVAPQGMPLTQAAPPEDAAKLDEVAAKLPPQVTSTIAKLTDLDPNSPQYKKNVRVASIQIEKMFPGVDAEAVIKRMLEQNAQGPFSQQQQPTMVA